jgi:hypothetical protein
MVIAMIITLVVNVPIDRQIQSWTNTLPPDWNAIRDRWEFYHGCRTFVSLVALACLFARTLSTTGRAAHDARSPGTARRATRDATADSGVTRANSRRSAAICSLHVTEREPAARVRREQA